MTENNPAEPAPESPAPQPQPAWAWAPKTQVVTVETEPLEYHRLLRGTSFYKWWKPFLLLLTAGAYFGVMSIIVALIAAPLLLAFDPLYLTQVAEGSVEILDTQRPMSLLVALASIIIMIPAVMLAMLTLGMRPVGRIWSVTGRIRWGLLLRLLGAAVLSVIVMNAVGIGLGLMFASDSDAGAAAEVADRPFDQQAMLISFVLIVLLVPFQSIAEEVAFRGLFMQVIGSWLKNPWWAILIPTLIFAAGHIYDLWGLSAVALLGGVAGWLTWRTGGLEAAMAIHVANNMIVFSLMASGVMGETAQTSDGSGAPGLIGEAVGLALYLWLTLKIFNRGRHNRSRIDFVEKIVPITQADSAAPGTERI